jgi:type I restriction enzyme M protein
LDRGKKKIARKNKVLFIDARNIYQQIDRAHRDWTDEQIEQIAGIVRSYRNENGKKYKDVKGLCRVATIEEVKKAGYSLNPGRYVGVTDNGGGNDGNFKERIDNLHKEFKGLTDEAHKLEEKIFMNLRKLDL